MSLISISRRCLVFLGHSTLWFDVHGDVCQHQEIHTTPESVIPGATAFSACRKYGAAMCAGLSVEPVCHIEYGLDVKRLVGSLRY